MKRGVMALAMVLPLLHAPAATAAPEGEGPDLWTVLISVKKYEGGIPPRSGADVDGRALGSWMIRVAGWEPDHVLQLNDDGSPSPGDPAAHSVPLRPTRANVEWAIRKWLGLRVKKGDAVLLAFAGRGATTDQGEALLPIDYRPGGRGWAPDSSVEYLLRDRKCSSVVCWIDAPMLAPAGPLNPPRDAGTQLMKRLARWQNSSVWMSTSEAPKDGGGGSAFAAALREALDNGRQPLQSILSRLNQDPKVQELRFRHLGGLRPELSLARDGFTIVEGPPAELLVQKGHADGIKAVAVRGDGQSLVTASEDSTIRVWNPRALTRPLLRVLPEFTNGVTAMALSPDGRYLVGGDGMGEIRAWECGVGGTRPIRPRAPRARGGPVLGLAFLPDAPPAAQSPSPTTRFVSIERDGQCVFWEIDDHSLSPKPIPVLANEKIFLLSAATRPGGPAAFVTLAEDGLLRAFNREAKQVCAIRVLEGSPRALLIDPEGRWAAVGDEDGRLGIVTLGIHPKVTIRAQPLGGAITALRVGPRKELAVGYKGGLALLPVDHLDQGLELDVGGNAVGAVEFSADGGWLAASTQIGDLFLWKFRAGHSPEPIQLGRAGGGPAGFSCLGFGPASVGAFLVAGENDGGVRRWDLDPLKELPRLEPHRGKVRQIGASKDGRFLVQVTDDGIAQVWDLKEGRNVRTLDGLWVGGAFLPDGRLAMTRHPDSGRGIALVDLKRGGLGAETDLRLVQGGPRAFGRVAVSSDGRRVAALSAPGRKEVVGVWDLAGGTPRVIVPPPTQGAWTSLDFSEDGEALLTASEDGVARLWDLSAPEGTKAPAAEYKDRSINMITAARLGPGRSRKVVVAGLTPDDKTFVLYWDGKAPADGARPTPVKLGEFPNRVLAVAFLDGGRYVAAAGRDRLVRIWEVAEGRRAEELSPVVIGSVAAQYHTEAINDLIAWPGTDVPTLASASDDTTVRFWRIEPREKAKDPTVQLRGILVSAPQEGPGRPGPTAKGQGDARWVAYTPEGVYDSSLDGERLVTFSDGREVQPLDQYAARLHHPLLTDKIRRGIPTPPDSYTPPPPLLIEAPEDISPDQAEVEIRISLGDASLDPSKVRIYQNDVPVRSGDGEGFRPLPNSKTEFAVSIHLVPGDNRFYAMAGRDKDIDARSEDLLVYHADPNVRGRLHVISLGVGKYDRNVLKFPVDDARQFADFIRDHGVGAGKELGERIVLPDEKVNARSIQGAFSQVRDKVRGRPQDTVVVFMAGHTDLLARPGGESGYSLLLTNFPFPKDDPLQVVARGPGIAGAIRRAPEGTYLPYATIYHNLSTLDALQRLVIIDACQAEAARDDPAVRAIEERRRMDREARPSRINYFFASRRGESAKEATALKHGVLTYVMLRGMGAPGLEEVPGDLQEFRQLPSADFDGDKTITTKELHAYVDRVLPALADHLPGQDRGAPPAAPAPAPGAPRFAAPWASASAVSFPLVVIPPETSKGK